MRQGYRVAQLAPEPLESTIPLHTNQVLLTYRIDEDIVIGIKID